MIELFPPVLRHEEKEVFMECDLIAKQSKAKLYYSTPIQFEQYLLHERTDAFLLAILQYAMKKGEDIIVKGAVSEKLYFNLTTHVIPLLASALGHQRITIHAEKLDNTVYPDSVSREPVVGTGCSMGVDSFSTILYYTSDKIPASYRVNCLTLFNVGANGNDVAKTKDSFKIDKPMAEEYAGYKHLPLVTLTSNIGMLYEGWDFALCHHTRNAGAVLALQKLFTKYIYASSYPSTELRISRQDPSHFETALLPYLSTENTELIIGLPNLTRTEKTSFIAEYPETYNRLYVCLKQVLKNDYDSFSLKNETKKRNCSSCEKCKRTMLTLDLLNKRDCYSSVFDWGYFDTQRFAYIGYALANRNRKGKDFYKELCDLMEKEHFSIPLRARWYQGLFSFFYLIKRPRLINF